MGDVLPIRKHPRERLREELLSRIKGDGAAALVLLAVVGRCSDRDETWASADLLGSDAGVCERTVRRALKRLQAAGVVSVDSEKGCTSTVRLSPDWLIVFSTSNKNHGQSQHREAPRTPESEPRTLESAVGSTPRTPESGTPDTGVRRREFQEESSNELLSPTPSAPEREKFPATQGKAEQDRPASQDRPEPSPAAPAPENEQRPASAAPYKAPLSPDASKLFDYLARISRRYVPDLDVTTWWPKLPKAHVIVANKLLQRYPVNRLLVAIRWAWEDQFWTGAISDVMALNAKVSMLVAKSSRVWEQVRETPDVWEDPER